MTPEEQAHVHQLSTQLSDLRERNKALTEKDKRSQERITQLNNTIGRATEAALKAATGQMQVDIDKANKERDEQRARADLLSSRMGISDAAVIALAGNLAVGHADLVADIETAKGRIIHNAQLFDALRNKAAKLGSMTAEMNVDLEVARSARDQAVRDVARLTRELQTATEVISRMTHNQTTKEPTMARIPDNLNDTPKAPSHDEAPTPPTALQMFRSNANDAAWRTGANQLVKLVRDPLVAFLAERMAPGDESMRKKLGDFLATETGTAMLAGLLSFAVTAAPAGLIPATTAERLTYELRVKALADVGDVLAEFLAGPLRAVLAGFVAGPGAELLTSLPPAEPAALPAAPPKASRSRPRQPVEVRDSDPSEGNRG